MLKIAYTLNIAIYSSSLVLFLLGFGQVSSLFCVAGLFLNVWSLIKYYPKKIIDAESSLGKSDRSLIMEDLDREADRRREVEKLYRN